MVVMRSAYCAFGCWVTVTTGFGLAMSAGARDVATGLAPFVVGLGVITALLLLVVTRGMKPAAEAVLDRIAARTTTDEPITMVLTESRLIVDEGDGYRSVPLPSISQLRSLRRTLAIESGVFSGYLVLGTAEEADRVAQTIAGAIAAL